MSFGSKDPQTTTTTTEHQLSKEQQNLLGLAMPGIQEWSAKPFQRFQGSQIAGFDPSQTAGQNALLGAAGTQQGISDRANAANAFWTGQDIWKPENNPALQGAIDASVRPITQQLNESILPQLRGGAAASGNFGSSRRGIAEGLAVGRASQAVGDTASKLVNDQYRTNVQAQLQALGMAPMLQQAALQPGITTSNVGDVRQNLTQRQLGETAANFNLDQNGDYLKSRELISLLSGIPGGSNVSTAVGPPPGNGTLTNVLGGAASGGALGNLLFPGVGAIPGATLGGLGGLFFR